jgi:hypothetical protein
MASVSISAQRAAQVDKTCRDFVARFVKPLGATSDDGQWSEEDFAAIFTPSVHWYDHAFLICRQGHEAVMGLQVAFRHCNQPFDVEFKVRSVEQTSTCKNDYRRQ